MPLHPRHAVFTGFEGNRLEADVYGHGGRVALLLHGGGQTRHAWRATARRLAERGFTAVSVDQRGHGDSVWIDSGAYAFQDYARDVLALARQIEERFGARPVAIGASLGGVSSLRALGIDAQALAGLVLVDITPHMEQAGIDHIQGFMAARSKQGFASIEEAADCVAAYLPNRTRPPSVEGLRKNLRLKPDGRWYWHWDPRFLDGPRTVNTDYDTLTALLEADARSLVVPTLLVRGGSSDVVTLEAVAKFRALVPTAQFADVRGAGHMVAGDKNDAFADAILAFLA
ncbi:alpha/beta hydrolase [Phreatobacter aquaticus]|uniref:Alpha/beta hydrolase n=1 Tax=Phreatobacter aquaticus TaxID=2570229 RepID=A0A4D7QSH1_9HYPH|nr:alpha/beta hydrolase [Phreatobacter aquaticus]QCK87947.1 alpha/beta hydrolase [Phreatobacter aquaticus]